LFLILFSLTDIRNYVTAEICIFVFCLSVTIIPLILELIVYSLGLITKGIQTSSKEDVIMFKPMKNSKVPYTVINENGVSKMMFFCDKGRITILTAKNTTIHWGEDEDKIIIKSKFGECFSLFKNIYGTKYENVECDVYTTLKEAVEETKAEKTEDEKKVVEKEKTIAEVQPSITQPPVAQPSTVQEIVPEIKEDITTQMPQNNTILSTESSGMSMVQPEFNIDANPKPNPALESVEEFDYSLKDTDTLFEETIKL